MLAIYEEFHDRCFMEHSLDATFLVLIPKKPGASALKDFRPIFLISSMYKNRAKILANWFKRVLGNIRVDKSSPPFYL